MTGFAEVLAALAQGKHVRQDRWDAGSELFVKDGRLMKTCNGSTRDVSMGSEDLTWLDMNRKDWCIL